MLHRIILFSLNECKWHELYYHRHDFTCYIRVLLYVGMLLIKTQSWGQGGNFRHWVSEQDSPQIADIFHICNFYVTCVLVIHTKKLKYMCFPHTGSMIVSLCKLTASKLRCIYIDTVKRFLRSQYQYFFIFNLQNNIRVIGNYTTRR